MGFGPRAKPTFLVRCPDSPWTALGILKCLKLPFNALKGLKTPQFFENFCLKIMPGIRIRWGRCNPTARYLQMQFSPSQLSAAQQPIPKQGGAWSVGAGRRPLLRRPPGKPPPHGQGLTQWQVGGGTPSQFRVRRKLGSAPKRTHPERHLASVKPWTRGPSSSVSGATDKPERLRG